MEGALLHNPIYSRHELSSDNTESFENIHLSTSAYLKFSYFEYFVMLATCLTNLKLHHIVLGHHAVILTVCV